MALTITFEGDDEAIDQMMDAYAEATGYGRIHPGAHDEQPELTKMQHCEKMLSNHFRSVCSAHLINKATEATRKAVSEQITEVLDSIEISGEV